MTGLYKQGQMMPCGTCVTASVLSDTPEGLKDAYARLDDAMREHLAKCEKCQSLVGGSDEQSGKAL